MAQNPFSKSPIENLADELNSSRYALPELPGRAVKEEAPAMPEMPAGKTQPAETSDASEPTAQPKAVKTAKADSYLPPPDIRPVFESAAREYGVPVNVLMALGHQESRYRANAVGTPTEWGRAKGIMQYLDSTAKGLGINPFDPAQSINAAAKQLKERLDKGYSMEDAVKEHFAGPDRKLWGEKTDAYGREVLEKATRIFGQPNDVPDGLTPLTPEQKKAHDEQITKNFSPAMPRDQYEYGFTLLNPSATPEDVQRAMSAYDEFQAQQTQAGENRVQQQFEILKSPEATFKQKLDAKLAGPRNGIVPQLPGQLQTDAAAENAQREQANKGWFETQAGYMGTNLKLGWNNLMNSVEGLRLNEYGALLQSFTQKYTPEQIAADPELQRELKVRQDGYNRSRAAIAERSKENEKLSGTMRPETQEFFAAADKEGTMAQLAAIGDAVMKNPVGIISDLGIQSGPQSLAMLAAAIMARLSGGTTTTAAVAGGGTSAFLQFGSDYAQLREEGRDHDDAWRTAAAKSAVVGSFDAVSMGSAGKALDAVMGGASVAKKAGTVVKELGKQSGLGMAGEALGSVASGRDIEPVAVAAEGLGELVGAPIEALGTFGGRKPAEQQAKPGAAPGAAPNSSQPAPNVAPSPNTATEAAKSGPLTAAVEEAAGVNPDRVTVTTPTGTVAGFLESAGPDGSVRILGDDGQVYQYGPNDNVQVAKIEPTGPLTSAVEQVAESAPVAQSATTAAPVAEQVATPEPMVPAVPSQEGAGAPVAAAPEQKRVEDMDEAEARDRLKYLAGQFKRSSDNTVRSKIAKERKKVEAHINALVAQKEAAPVEAIKTSEIKDVFGGMGKGITDAFYDKAFDALTKGKSTMSGVKEPVLSRAKAAFDAGLIKSPDDLRKFENDGYPKVEAKPETADADGFLRRFIKNKDAADEIAADIGGRVVKNEKGSFDIVPADNAETVDNQAVRRGRDDRFGIDVEMVEVGGGFTITTSDENQKPIKISSGLGGIYLNDRILNMDGEFVPAKQIVQVSTGTEASENTPYKPKNKAELARILNLVAEIAFARETGKGDVANQFEQQLYELVTGKESANANANADGRSDDGRMGGADRADGAGVGLPAGSERADAALAEQSGRAGDDATDTGAGSADAAPAADAQPALSETQTKAIERVRKGTAFFGTKEKADGWVAKNEVGDLVEIEQTGPVRFTVKEKVAATEAAPAEAPAITSENGKPGVVVVQQAVVDAMDGQMRKQKARITRLKNEAEKAGSLEDKRAAQLKVAAAEATLRKMRTSRFDAEDAAIKAIETGDIAAFAPHADIYGDAAAVIEQMLGQNDELDAEMQAYEAKADKPSNPNPSESQAVNDFIEGRRDTPPSVEEVKEEAAADINGFRAVLIKNIRDIIPMQQKYERVFGRGQWAGYVKKLIAGNDVLRQFSKTPGAAGDAAWVKPALAKAVEAKDLIRIAEKLEAAAAKSDPTPPKGGKKADPFANNKLFTSDKVAAARERMKSKLSGSQLNAGIDPELLVDGMTIAGAYIESGVRSFSDYAKAMVDDFGDAVKPYLLSFYEGARAYPGLETEGMSTVDEAKAQHAELMTPAVMEEASEAIGEITPKPAKRTKKTGAKGDMALTQDWGVDHIDGYGDSNDRDPGNDLKDAFIAETRKYLNAVAATLAERGYLPQKDGKGRDMKPVSVNEGGVAGSGEVSLTMYHPDGGGIYAHIGDTSLRGVVPTTPSGIAIMYRGASVADKYGSKSTNRWAPVDLSAADLAAMLETEAKAKAAQEERAKDGNANPPAAAGRAGNRALEGAPAAEVRGAQEGRDAEQRGAESGREDAGRAGNTDRAGVPDGSGMGDGARDVSVPARGTGGKRGRAGQRRVQAESGAEPSLFESVAQERAAETAEARDQVRAAGDYQITDLTRLGEGGQKTKYRNNVAAIRLLNELQETGRAATPAEQDTLARYVGWGGLAQAFDAGNAEWSKEHAELKELLTPEEWEAAKESTQYAHYTSQEIIGGMYEALKHMGFAGGKILEPGSGVGNFMGLMPAELRGTSRFTAVERERIAGGIAKALYPNQNVQQEDFRKFNANDGYFDVALGNPPFSSTTLTDLTGRKHLSGLSIHNYFFAKSIDMLREGGILAMVVSNSFMDAKGDKARRYIGERAELLGAIRLPNNAFAKNANTEVTTDIIFLRKRPESEWGSKVAKDDLRRWQSLGEVRDPLGGDPIPVNQYFIDNPSMMLGRMERAGSMYRANAAALVANEGQDTAAMLNEAVKRLPADAYQAVSIKNTADMVEAEMVALADDANVDVGGHYVKDGDLFVRMGDVAGEGRAMKVTATMKISEKKELGANGLQRLKDLASMRVTLRKLLAAEMADSAEMDTLRADLNRQYDAYVKENGYINQRGTVQLFGDDPDFPLLASLEHGFDPGISAAAAKAQGVKAAKPSARKAPIFERRVIEPHTEITKAESPEDALMVSIAERGQIDPDYIGRLLGRDGAEVLDELTKGEEPALFIDPATGGYVLRDAYLSGNVRKKLAQAKAAGAYKNVAALEQVIPEDIPAHEISGKIGAPWVPVDVYEEFATEIMGEGTKARIIYIPATSGYIANFTPGSDVMNTNTFGTPRMSAADIFDALLNSKDIRVGHYEEDPVSRSRRFVLEKEPTDEANDKAREIKDKFNDWLFADAERAERMQRTYNDAVNNYVTRKYDGSMLRFPGKVPDAIIKFRRHQRNAIARIIQDGTALLDHVVGAGKTFTVIGAAMELKRTGLAKKPMIVVPNHLVKQWAADFYRLYPGANILTATKKDFQKANRRKFLAKIATGNWDAVIMAHSSYGFIKPDAEFEIAFNEERIREVLDAIEALEKEGGDQAKRTVKQIEAMKERLDNRLKAIRDKPMDDLLDFGQLGVDQLFVDEAHLFKNLMFVTKMQNVRGLGQPKGSQRAYDMFIKTHQTYERNGGERGVVFATGTPVSNSLAEMYHMLRYLAPQSLKDAGQFTFDAWAKTFADVEQVWMQSMSGDGYKASNRMSRFVNTPELLRVFDQVADTVTLEDIKAAYSEENKGAEFPIPPLKGGRRQPVSIPRTQAQTDYMDEIAKRAKELEQRKGKPQKGDDNMLSIMGDARKAAMDIRMVRPDISERDPNGRIAIAAGNIFDRYQKYNDVRGTQLVFSDMGTPKKQAAKELAEYNELMEAVAPLSNPEITAMAELGDEAAMTQLEKAEEAQRAIDAKGQDWLDAIKAAMRGFSTYDDLKDALIEKGIPENEVAFIHDYNTDDQKAALFRAVNDGKIRVLLGSTEKMGAGTNVQERAVALHHLDVPWKPSDIEQREGRIVRQGNKLLGQIDGFEVEVLAYATQDTLDLFMWQTQEKKLAMIAQLRTGNVGREVDNAFEEMQMSAGEMQAAATSNPYLLEEIQLKDKVKRLERQKRSFEGQKNDLMNRKKKAERDIAELPAQIKTSKAIEKIAEKTLADIDAHFAGVKATVNGETITGAPLIRDTVRAAIQASPVVKKGEGDKAKEVQQISIELNGKEYTSASGIADALNHEIGDAAMNAFTLPNGTTVYRAAEVASSAVDTVANMLEAGTDSAVLGKMGDFEVTAYAVKDGQIEISISLNGDEVAGYDFRYDTTEPGGLANQLRQIPGHVRGRIEALPGQADYLQSKLEKAKKTLADIESKPAAGAWDGDAELKKARDEHRAILKKLAEVEPEAATEQAEPKYSVSPDQAETPAFKKWFGDSKVVDAEGKPLVVFHGTDADITEFNTKGGRGKTFGTGAFFTSRNDLAATYTSPRNGGNIMPVYLSLENPVIIDAGGANWSRLGKQIKLSTPKVTVLDENEEIAAALEDRQPDPNAKVTKRARSTSLGRLFPDEFKWDDWFSTDDLARWARKEGYDGVIFRNVGDRGPSGTYDVEDTVSDVYVAFRPEQIKSAVGNNGDFDPANPDIRHSNNPDGTEVVKSRSAGMSPAQLKHEITKGMMGPIVRAMIDNGLIVIHETTATMPQEARGVRGVQGFVMADGKIHLVPQSISVGRARGVMLHEVFHALLKQSLGAKKYEELMDMLGKIYRQYGNSGGKANAFVSGFQRVLEGKKRKDKDGNSIIPVGMEVEEFGAYSIEEYMREPDSLPGLIRRWVEDLMGFVKAAAYKWLGKQYGELTPAQLATLAKFAVMDVASANRGMMFGPAAEWFSVAQKTDTPAFRRWFGKSKVVDADGKPLVMYHGTAEDFTEFKPGRRGGAIFLSPNKDFAASYANEKGFAKAGYPDVGEPAFDGSNVMPVYVKAVKPFDYSNSSHVAAVAKRVAKTDPGGPNEAGIANGSWAIIERDSVQEAIKSLGFDGYYVEEMGVKNLAVYSPFQIKSAIGNNGDFDPSNPDIRYSVSPEQEDDVLDAAEKALEKRKDDYIGDVVGDMSLFAKLLVHPRTVASIHKRFTPVYQTGISQMETRDETIAELGADMHGYADLPQESKQRVNQVLELGRLASAVFTPTELADGVVNTGTKNVVVIDEKTGKPKMTKVPVEATLTAAGEVVLLSKEEIDAYRGLRRMFDSALDRMRDQTLEEIGFGGFARMDGKRPLVIEDAGNGKVVLKGSIYSDEEKAELRAADGDKKRIAEILSTNPIMPIIRKFEGGKWNPELMGYEFGTRQRDALESEMGDYLKKSAATQILELIDDLTPPDKAERIKNVAAFIGEIEQAKRAGYVPFARYGDYVVTVKESIADPNYLDNGDGRLIVQGLPDSFAEDMIELGATPAPKNEGGGWMIPADKKRDVERLTEKTVYSTKVELGPLEKAKYRNAKKVDDIPAVKAAIEKARKEWIGDNPNRRIVSFKVREKQADKPVSLSDVDALAEVANLDNATWDFVRDKLADAIKARGFRRHFFHSDNVPGYSGDFERSMADYVIGMAGYLSRRQHMRQWDNAITAIKDQPRLHQYASKYRDYVNNPQEELALVRQLGFFSYIAGVVASAVTNVTQVPLLTIPTLSQIAPTPLVLKEVARAYKDAVKMLTRSMDFFDPSKAPADIREALMDAWNEGSFVPLETLDLMMTARQRNVGARKGVKLFNDLTKVVATTFTFAERLNRLVTFIASARLAAKEGVKKTAASVLKADALARREILGSNWNQKNVAKWAIDESQYRMGKANRPTTMRGVGAAIMQFKSFLLQTFEAWYRMAALHGKEGKFAAAASIASVLAFSGLWGMPGGDDLRAALEKLYRELTGEDLDMKTEFRAWVARVSGSNYLAAVATKGIPYAGIPYFGIDGIDMTRVGMGNVAPDSPLAAAGIPFDMLLGRPMRAFEKTAAGSPMLGVAEMSPNFIKNWITAGVWSADGVRDKRGNRIVGPDDIDGGDVALRGIGWTPTFITDVRDYEYAQRREETAVSGLKSDYTGRLARAMAKSLRTEDVKESEKLDAEIAGIYAEIEEHNAKAPASRQIEIGNTALRNRIQRELGGVSVRWGKESKRAREQAEELRGVFGLSEDDE